MLNRNAYPRPEYPRPDRQRAWIEGVDWINLNGPWQFRFATLDADSPDAIRDNGWRAEWFRPDHDAQNSDDAGWREQIIVPFCWESLAAWGEGDAAGNDNYYATRVFLNPLEVTAANHRSSPRYEVGWYRREVRIPAETQMAWRGKRVILTVGAADFFSDGWCNGIQVGHHEGGYTPFEFDLTDALETLPDGSRRGTLVLRVEDPMDNRQQPVGKQWQWYTTISGIWQTVWIEPRHQAHIDCFRITPDIDQAVAHFHIECSGLDKGCKYEVEVAITPPQSCVEGEVFRERIAVQPTAGKESGAAVQTIAVIPLCLWDPNQPDLYRVVLCLHEAASAPKRGGQSRDQSTLAADGKAAIGLDEVHSYFGMRKIDAESVVDGESSSAPMILRFNNEPRYLRGALYQSYHPDGVYTAGDAEVIRDDILFAKKAGFNFLRVHIKIDDPLVLYYADTLGILLMCDFPNFGEGGDTPLARARYEAMTRQGIKRDYNHPSIIAWCLFNETWGFGGQVELVKHFPNVPTRARRKIDSNGALLAAASPIGAAADGAESSTPNGAPEELPSNAVSAEAPAAQPTLATVETPATKLANLSAHTWVQSMWQMAKTLDNTRLIEDMSVVNWEHLDYFGHVVTDINSWHFYIDDYARAKEHIEKIVQATYAGSTFNYVAGFEQGSQPLINSEYGGVGALDGDRDISWSFKFLTNEMRRHGSISAYIFTQLHDVEWEYNGFLNYDRTAKEFGYDPRIINESNVLPIDCAPIARYNAGETVRVPVASSHFSTQRHQNVKLEWRLSGMDAEGRLHTDLSRGLVPIKFPHWRVAPAHTIEFQLPQSTFLGTLAVAAIDDAGEVLARNFVQFLGSDGYPPAREERDNVLFLRALPADWAHAGWPRFAFDREKVFAEDCLWGEGTGFFQWDIPLDGADLSSAKRLQVLCEASSHPTPTLPGATPQTDGELTPTTFEIALNGARIFEERLKMQPHDARGVLSYLRGGKGAYGYLAHATAEGDLLREIASRAADGYLRLRCAVPEDAIAQNGLAIYGAECGRYPICPTILVEW